MSRIPNDLTLLALARLSLSPTETAIAGRPCFSAIRAATKPRMPGCQSLCPIMITCGSEPGPPLADLCVGLADRRPGKGLALAVVLLHERGLGARLLRLGGRKQLEADLGIVESTRSVETRNQPKGERHRVQRLITVPRDFYQRSKSGTSGTTHSSDALADKVAVLADQRSHVANRAQRDQFQKRFRGLLARVVIDSLDELVRQADARQVNERVAGVRAIRIDQRLGGRVGRVFQHHVVIGHDAVDTELFRRFYLCVRVRAAVHRDQDGDALVSQRPHRVDVDAVPFVHPVRDVRHDTGSEST